MTNEQLSTEEPGSLPLSPFLWALVVAAFVGLGFVVFGAGLDGPFVYDDTDAIVQNETLDSFTDALWPPVDTSFAGRPMVNLSVWMDRVVFGIAPETVHRTNLLLHVLCVVIGMLIVRRVVAGPRVARPDLANFVALGAGLLALVHPLNSEVVYYASPRSELVLALFFLGTFYALARAAENDGKHRAWFLATIVLAWFGALSKEVMVVAPFLGWLFLGAYFTDGFADAWKRHRKLLLGVATCLIPALILIAVTPRSQSVGFAIAGGPLDYLRSQCTVLPAYLLRVVWPADLVFDYGMLLPVSWGKALPGFVLLSVLFVAACVTTWKRPALGFPALFAFVVLAPSSSLMPIVTEIGADRRVYMPLFAGLATIIFFAARSGGAWLAVALAAVLAVPLALTSHARGDDFATHLALWESVVEARPDNARAWYNVANEHASAGRFSEALPAISRASELFPGEGVVRLNHGAVLSQLGRTEEALFEFEAADNYEPSSKAKDAQLRILVGLGRKEEARRRLNNWELDDQLRATARQFGFLPPAKTQ